MPVFLFVSGNIRVFCRVRPVGENENGNPVVISFDSIDDSVVTVNVEVKHRMNNSDNTVQLCGHIYGMRDGRMVKKLVFCAMGGKPGKDGGSG